MASRLYLKAIVIDWVAVSKVLRRFLPEVFGLNGKIVMLEVHVTFIIVVL